MKEKQEKSRMENLEEALTLTFAWTQSVTHRAGHGGRSLPYHIIDNGYAIKIIDALGKNKITIDEAASEKKIRYALKGTHEERESTIPYLAFFSPDNEPFLAGVILRGEKRLIEITLDNYRERLPPQPFDIHHTVLGPGSARSRMEGLTGKIVIAHPEDADGEKIFTIRQILEDVYHPERVDMREKLKGKA